MATPWVWFDDLVIGGRFRPRTRRGRSRIRWIPDAIPRTFGANLVVGRGFEQPFAGGVSAGWASGQRWAAARGDNPGWARSAGPLRLRQPRCLADMNQGHPALWRHTQRSDPVVRARTGLAMSVPDGKYPHLEHDFYRTSAIDSNWEIYKTAPCYGSLPSALDQAAEIPELTVGRELNRGQDWRRQRPLNWPSPGAHELGESLLVKPGLGRADSIWRMVDETFSPSCRSCWR